MASLTGQSVASSYEQLLHVDRDGGGNATTLVDIKDGDNGTTFALQLATDKINVKGNNGNASHTLLKIHNNDDPSNSETGQTADIEFSFQGTTNGGSSFVTKNAGSIRAGKDSDYFTSSADNMDSHLKFYTAQDNVNTLALTIDSNQVVELNNGQLQFPASQNASSDANTLDDYEEGTWTPILSDGTNNFTMGANQNGRYTKIGRVVHFEAECGTSSIGSASGALKLIGLPFTSASSTSEGVCSIGFLRAFNYSADTIQLMAQVNGGTTEIAFFASKDDATEETVQCSQADSSSFFIRISGTYFV
jgi:hypothetical protein